MPGKYDHLSKEQLIALLEEREKEKRLGLVWERDPALVGRDESVNEQFVTLNHDKAASCGSGAQRNLIIEGGQLRCSAAAANDARRAGQVHLHRPAL